LASGGVDDAEPVGGFPLAALAFLESLWPDVLPVHLLQVVDDLKTRVLKRQF